MAWRGAKILRTTSVFRHETKADIPTLGFSHPMKSMEVHMNPGDNDDNDSNWG